jgi:hypothetical protein
MIVAKQPLIVRAKRVHYDSQFFDAKILTQKNPRQKNDGGLKIYS